MLNFLDVFERALDGPLMTENDFDMKIIVPTVREVVKTYRINTTRVTRFRPTTPRRTISIRLPWSSSAGWAFTARIPTG